MLTKWESTKFETDEVGVDKEEIELGMNYSYYGSASIPKWPQKLCQGV